MTGLVVLMLCVPACYVYLQNIDRLPPTALTSTLVALSSGAAVACVGSFVVFRRSPTALWLIVVLVFFAVSARYLFPFSRSPWVLTLAGVVLGTVVVRFPASRRLVAGILSVASVTHLSAATWGISRSPIIAERPAIRDLVSTPHLVASTTEAKPPNIYYLVFDRYARQDQLLKHYDFDNEEFLRELEARGFIVSRDAFANYQRTAHSLASALNFQYLNPSIANSEDWVPIYQLLDRPVALASLKDLGYRLHNLGSWWEPTRRLAMADDNYSPLTATPILRELWQRSPLGVLASHVGGGPWDLRWTQCKRSALKFDRLRTIAESDRPVFVFAHFLVPHPPYVVDRAGNCLSVAEAESRSRTANYIDQLVYTNRKILEAVDRLMSQPGPPPVIVLQADEGPWPAAWAGEEVRALGTDTTEVDWTRATDDELVEKMAILSAAYFPKPQTGAEIRLRTPINTMRTIFRAYFGMNLPPLDDRAWIFQSNDDIHRYRDVTSQIAGGGAADTKL